MFQKKVGKLKMLVNLKMYAYFRLQPLLQGPEPDSLRIHHHGEPVHWDHEQAPQAASGCRLPSQDSHHLGAFLGLQGGPLRRDPELLGDVGPEGGHGSTGLLLWRPDGSLCPQVRDQGRGAHPLLRHQLALPQRTSKWGVLEWGGFANLF